MYKKYPGFTLIELVIVIVILGILAVIAIPQFLDLSQDAKLAAVQGVAGALSSANAVNYASRKENSANGIAVANCSSVALALNGATLPAGYTIAAAAVANGSTSTCTLTYSPTTGSIVSTSFTATGVT